MAKFDARCIPPLAQVTLRQRAVAAVHEGMSQAGVARILGVSRQSVNAWAKSYRKSGEDGLAARQRGRPRESRLRPAQVATTIRMITDGCPDQLKLPFALWTREAVAKLLACKFGVKVSVWTVGRYLQNWGLTPQKPVRRAFEQNPEAVRRWLEEEYPGLKAAAQRERAEIHWGDQMGMRSDHQTGRSYGLRGQTPVVPGTGQRFSCNMISTVTNRGQLSFMLFRETFTIPVFLKFLRRLLRHRKSRVYLIVDRHSVHKSGRVATWVARHHKRIRLILLPAFSPELNPDELLNQDVKSNAIGRVRPSNQKEMMDGARTYLRSTQAHPRIVANFFQEEHVRYAAL